MAHANHVQCKRVNTVNPALIFKKGKRFQVAAVEFIAELFGKYDGSSESPSGLF